MNTLTCYTSGMYDTDIVYDTSGMYDTDIVYNFNMCGMYDTDIVYEYFNMLY